MLNKNVGYVTCHNITKHSTADTRYNAHEQKQKPIESTGVWNGGLNSDNREYRKA